jgi:hypothetical protein
MAVVAEIEILVLGLGGNDVLAGQCAAMQMGDIKRKAAFPSCEIDQ